MPAIIGGIGIIALLGLILCQVKKINSKNSFDDVKLERKRFVLSLLL